MADFEIEPHAVPIGGAGVSFPDLDANLSAKGDAFAKAQELLQKFAKQRKDQQDADAMVKYKQKLADLDVSMAGDRNFQTRPDRYKAGIAKIQSELTKEYPYLSNTAMKGIQIEMINDYRQEVIRTANEAHTQGIADLKAFGVDTRQALKEAQTPQARQALLKNALDHYDQSAQNNLISPAEAAASKSEFIRAAHEDDADDLSLNHPDQYLQKTAAQLGISTEKYNEGRNRALKAQSVDNSAAGIRERQEELAAANSMNVGNAQSIANRFPRLRYLAASFLGHEPLTPQDLDDSRAIPFLSGVQSANSVDEVTAWKEKAAKAGLRGNGKLEFTIEASSREADLKKHSTAVDDYLNSQLDSYIVSKDTTYHNPSAFNYRDNFSFNKNLESTLKYQLSQAKDDSSKLKLLEQYKDQVTTHNYGGFGSAAPATGATTPYDPTKD